MKHQTNHLSVQSLAGRHPFLTASFCTPAPTRACPHPRIHFDFSVVQSSGGAAAGNLYLAALGPNGFSSPLPVKYTPAA